MDNMLSGFESLLAMGGNTASIAIAFFLYLEHLRGKSHHVRIERLERKSFPDLFPK